MNLKYVTTIAALGMLATPALAQTLPPGGARPGNEIGTGQSLPLSNKASNITSAPSVIAPRLPSPAISEDSPPAAFLNAAKTALAAGRTGEAQEALERAESRALSRDVAPSRADAPSGQPLVKAISQARTALGSGDRAATMQAIDAALSLPAAQ